MNTYKYISENELHSFDFHDCLILDAQHCADITKWKLEKINVNKINTCNNLDISMETDNAVIMFYRPLYNNVEKNYGYTMYDTDSKIEKINNNSACFINNSIIGGELYACNKRNDNAANFLVNHSDHLFSFDIKYSKVVVMWNEYVTKSWFDR